MIQTISLTSHMYPLWALCAGATALLCVFAMPLCRAFRLLDVPNERKKHARPTPLMGGLALVMAFLPVYAIQILVFDEPGMRRAETMLAIATAAMAIIGMMDDRHSLSARDRIILSAIVFGSLAALSPVFNVRILNFALLDIAFGLGAGWLAVGFTTLCCVGLVNAINMADGKNGLVIGLCLGWLGLLATRAPHWWLLAIGLVAAVLLVLLIFNLRGLLFLGDGGAYGFAAAIGLLAISIYNAPGPYAGRAISADELMLLFAVPVLDSFRLTFVRMRRGQSPMAGDRDHLHHHLLDRFGWPGGLIVYWAIALLPAAIVMLVWN